MIIFRRRQRSSGCFLARHLSDDEVQPGELLLQALDGKVRQLKPHASAGTPTVLLLDNDDIGLLAPGKVAEAFRQVASKADLRPFTEIYLVDSTEQPPWSYPLKLGDRLHPLPEYERMLEAQVRAQIEQGA